MPKKATKAFKFPSNLSLWMSWNVTKRLVRKKITEKMKILIPNNYQSKRKILDQWTFLDADVSEVEYYVGHGIRFNGFHVELGGMEGQEMPRLWFKLLEQQLWNFLREEAERDGSSRSIPRIEFGVFVPESKVPLLLKLREEYWSDKA